MPIVPFFGNQLEFYTQTAPGTGSVVKLNNIKDIDLPSSKRDKIDVTGLDSTAKESIAGPLSVDDVKISLKYMDPTDSTLTAIENMVNGALTGSIVNAHVKINYGTGSYLAMTGSFTSFSYGKGEFGKPLAPEIVFSPNSIQRK